MIRRTFKTRNKDVMLSSISHWSDLINRVYWGGGSTWNPHLCEDINCLETVQNSATKIMEVPRVSYEHKFRNCYQPLRK